MILPSLWGFECTSAVGCAYRYHKYAENQLPKVTVSSVVLPSICQSVHPSFILHQSSNHKTTIHWPSIHWWTGSYIALSLLPVATQSALQHCLRITHSYTYSRRWQPCKAAASSSGAVRLRCLALATWTPRGSNQQPCSYQPTRNNSWATASQFMNSIYEQSTNWSLNDPSF